MAVDPTVQPSPLYDLLHQMHEDADSKVQVLYKYRPCTTNHLDFLRTDRVWFSTRAQLNDPFDCQLRLPQSISQADIETVRRHLVSVEPYDLKIRAPQKVAEFVGASNALPALVPLGLMAAQLGFTALVKHIRRIELQNDIWVRNLILMARELVQFFLTDTTVFCLSAHNDHPLMWAHYANSHAGFCVGYICPVGIDNPRIIFKVEYAEKPPAISCWQLIEDPGSVHRDLVTTKAESWSYEREWRLTFRNMPGGLDFLLPYREIILGAKISDADESLVREAVGGRKVNFFRAVLDQATGTIGVEPA